MKLTPTTFILGLGLSAAIASEEANLRANASSRQLSYYSNQHASGGTWLFYLMLNTVAAPIDLAGYGCGDSACSGSSSGSRSRELWGTDGYSTTTTSSSSWTNDAYSTSSSSSGGISSHSSSSSTCPVRCRKAPHLHKPHIHKPKPKTKKNGGGSSSGGSSSGGSSSGGKSSGGSSSTYTTWTNDGHSGYDGNTWTNDGHSGYDGNTWTNDGHTDDYSMSWGNDANGDKAENGGGAWYNDDGVNSGGGNNGGNAANGGNGYGYGGNDDANGGSSYGYGGNDDANKNMYLSNNGNGNGSASKVNGAKRVPVWPFLVAALAVGVVAAALMANKRKKARQGNHALNGSIKRRMELFSGGLHRKEKPAAESSLSENDYENEPRFVEMRDPDDMS